MDFTGELVRIATEHWFTLAIASIVAVVLFHFGTKHSRQLKPYSHLPGPKPWPFLNRLPTTIKARGQIHEQFDWYYKKYGKLFVMSSVNVSFGVSEPEMIKQILVKDFDSFCDGVVSELYFSFILCIICLKRANYINVTNATTL